MEYSDTEDLNEIIGQEDLFSDDSNDEKIEREGRNSEKNLKGETNLNDDSVKIKKKRQVKHGKRVKLNLDTLSGPNGLPALKKLFENFKFKGDNHEKEDLTNIMQILQQWMCFRLFPKGSFEYNMAQLENLGNRKNVQTYMKKIRLGIDTWGEQTLISNDHQECDTANSHEEQLNQNNFDLWWQQEIANVESDNNLSSNEATEPQEENNDSITEQSVQSFPEVTLTPEQLERIAKNKKLAEERRLQRLMRENSTATSNLEELI